MILIECRFSNIKIQKFKENELIVYLKIYSNKEESKFYIELQRLKYCTLAIEFVTYRLDLKLEMITIQQTVMIENWTILSWDNNFQIHLDSILQALVN